MNTHTFDNHYLTCPICQRNATPKPVKTCIGLFTCPYCQERLVVCQSGHYVRDPSTLKQMMVSETLRRQSRPLARIVRDFILLKRPVVALSVAGAILLSMIAITQQSTSYEHQPQQNTQKLGDSGNKSQ